jgi:hypothetical protein
MVAVDPAGARLAYRELRTEVCRALTGHDFLKPITLSWLAVQCRVGIHTTIRHRV